MGFLITCLVLDVKTKLLRPVRQNRMLMTKHVEVVQENQHRRI